MQVLTASVLSSLSLNMFSFPPAPWRWGSLHLWGCYFGSVSPPRPSLSDRPSSIDAEIPVSFLCTAQQVTAHTHTHTHAHKQISMVKSWGTPVKEEKKSPNPLLSWHIWKSFPVFCFRFFFNLQPSFQQADFCSLRFVTKAKNTLLIPNIRKLHRS